MANKEYKLNIDPRILELLGPSLYTNIYYILAELIANAYDADAHNVYVIANKDDITVEDDGTGMSYQNGDIEHYLNVAKESRSSEEQALTKTCNRKKMGRKGVGKLAALSVSENVLVKTRHDGEVSGFILSRHVDADNHLTPIPDEEIDFQKITENGSAIVMQNPQYRLHKSLDVIKKNLLKIFPLVCDDFQIHIIRGTEEVIVSDFDKNVMGELCSVITLGNDFSSLADLVMTDFERRGELIEKRTCYENPIVMRDKDDVEHEYTLQVHGWIGTYKSTRGRKVEISDFPDNFISLFANKKLGEFNILPFVGQNKLNEVYIVGQLHIDLFELSELPDMALSNRQGYKSDDPRYKVVLDYVRDTLMPDILKKRDLYADIQSAERKKKKEEELSKKEKALQESFSGYKSNVAEKSFADFSAKGDKLTPQDAADILKRHLNESGPDLGLKKEVDSLKKKILISQTRNDKPLADIVYKMLLHNNVPGDDIIYTNCDDEIARIPEGERVYEYLRKFFVESYSTQKIYVLFVTSENTKQSWGALTEVGAAWITQIEHKIFNIRPFRPDHPLDDESIWHTTSRENNILWMDQVNADIFCSKIENVCDKLGYRKNDRAENKRFLGTLIEIRKL